LEWIETQPILNTVEILLNTLQIIDDLKTCKGILIETYQDVLGGNVNKKHITGMFDKGIVLVILSKNTHPHL
jgi:hypothetical protein